MDFANAHQLPVTIKVGNESVAVPRFTRGDWKTWASAVDAERLAKATENMDARGRAEFIAFYSVPPSTFDELRRRIATPDGCEYVVKTCLTKAGWDDTKVEQFFEMNDPLDVQTLAFLLIHAPRPKVETSKQQEGEPQGNANPPTHSAGASAG